VGSGGGSFARGSATGAAKIATRGDEDGVEEAGLGEAIGGQRLQADAKGKHSDERGDSNGYAERSQGIAQDRFAEIARG